MFEMHARSGRRGRSACSSTTHARTGAGRFPAAPVRQRCPAGTPGALAPIEDAADLSANSSSASGACCSPAGVQPTGSGASSSGAAGPPCVLSGGILDHIAQTHDELLPCSHRPATGWPLSSLRAFRARWLRFVRPDQRCFRPGAVPCGQHPRCFITPASRSARSATMPFTPRSSSAAMVGSSLMVHTCTSSDAARHRRM